ncbi:MAG: PEP-CTERM sorting domain-containing protein, partial [Verrucomicrobiota bacterium]|nr:PEP-CTERM sorting domain-containing protein [Verrucomicrobiota bacterium]
NVVVPNTFTWTVEFNGIAMVAGDLAGLVYYNPPTVGSSFNDWWKKTPEGWRPFESTDSNIRNNFFARVTAVPEPSVLALALLAGAMLVVRRK